MKLMHRLKLRTKLALVLGLAVLAVIVTVGAGASLMYQRMYDDRVAELNAVLQTTMSLAKGLEAQVVAKQITREQAIQQMRDDVHLIRYDGAWVTVYSWDGIILMQGAQPALEGKPGVARDSDGHTVMELARIALANADTGVIRYSYPRAGETVPKPKISLLGRFRPWDAVFNCSLYIDDLDADYRALLIRLSAIGGGILVVTLLIAWLVNHDIARSFGALRQAMAQLATGDLATEIPGTGRRDEVGAMAAAVLVFQQGLRKVEQLAGERDAERERADQDKTAALIRMADTIESETRGAVSQIGERTKTMQGAATDMSESAMRTGASAQSAAEASSLALATAQTVAGAAEQLAASIREISGQVGQSTSVVGRAVEAGAETRRTIDMLNRQVEEIGAVADMIGEIAARTNLLALNATIEAARAGDAGKGFAVVATEVKALATQTARSTADITRHIGEVRAATGASVDAVGRIEHTIGEMNAIVTSIAAAVEEQGAATADIARTVSQTAAAASEMSARTSEVSREAAQTGQRVGVVMGDINALNTAIDELRVTVVRVVRTSTRDVDRRATERYTMEWPARLLLDGKPFDVQVVDLSEGGARIVGGPAQSVGARGTLALDGGGLPLPFRVVGTDGGSVRLEFTFDAAAATAFHGVPERLSGRRAA
ncbi:MAG TPA: methyl-accepting chemotaxis protein [Acetobacteraceae bacterium]|nr:methyl-accepting chemotaxis protein [Acetobacteraceae bacterium]